MQHVALARERRSLEHPRPSISRLRFHAHIRFDRVMSRSDFMKCLYRVTGSVSPWASPLWIV